MDLTALDALDKVVAKGTANPGVKKYLAENTKLWHEVAAAQPQPGGWSVAPPQPPTTDITNPNGVGLNVPGAGGQSFHDFTSQGTLDSTVMLGPPQGPCTFTRFHLENAASLGAGMPDGRGRHALYAKAPGVTCYDWYVRGDPNAPAVGSCFSVRFANFHAERFDSDFLYLASLYDDDPSHTPGPATFLNGKAVYHADCAIWVDTSIPFAIHIENVDLVGNANRIMAVSANAAKVITVTVKNCTSNGQPAAQAHFNGITPVIS
jgi:hypothetical protein